MNPQTKANFIKDFKTSTKIIDEMSEKYFSLRKVNVLSTGKPIKKIFHVADIHIRRSNERFVEYCTVFENFHKILDERRNEDSLLVVCGDILHEKKGYSKESLKLFFNFFNKVNMPIIVIMGNHDGLIDNKSNYDQLDVLFEQTELKKVHYLKKSGIYSYNNINFAVSSCFDKKFIFKRYLPKDDKISISLFHGLVCSKEESKIFNTKNTRVIDMFDGFDYSLLGDIHTHKYLSQTIAYPGSLIQQSLSESFKGHGFIEWDIENKKSNFIEVENKYGHIKLCFVDNVLSERDEIPLHAKITINLVNSTKELCISKVNELTGNCKSYSLNWKKVEKKEKEVDGKKNEQQQTNFLDIESLIRKYCIENGNTQKEAEEICTLHKTLTERIKGFATQKTEVVSWKLLQLKFENIFSYGSGNIINFNSYHENEIIGVIGPNHYGKSSIIDILLYTLYDKCSRKIPKKELINKRKNKLSCECTIFSEGIYYKISKTLERGKKNTASTIFLSKSSDGKNYKYISIENITHATSIIESIVGNYDNFVKCNISLQDGENFIHMGHTDKINYLKEVASIDIFDDYESLAKDMKKKYTTESKIYKTQLANVNIHRMKTLIKTMDDRIQRLKAEIKEADKIDSLRNEIDELRKKCISNTKSIVLNTSPEKKIIEFEKKIENNKQQLSLLNEKLKSYATFVDNPDLIKEKESVEKNIYRIEKEIMNIKYSLSSLTSETEDSIQEKISQLSKPSINYETEENISSLEAKKKYLLKTLSQKKINAEKFDNFEYDKNCKFCVSNPFTKQAEEEKKKISEIEKKIEACEKNIEYAKYISSFNSLSTKLEEAKKKIQGKKKIEELENKLKKLREIDYDKLLADHFSYYKLKNEISSVTDSIILKEKQINYCKNIILEIEIEQKQKILSSISQKIKTLKNSLTKQKLERQTTEVNLNHYIKIEEAMKKIIINLELVTKYLKVIDKKGLPYNLLSQVIQEIENTANMYLEFNTSFKIAIKGDSSAKSINRVNSSKTSISIVKIENQEKNKIPNELNLHSCSGFEKFIIGFAIRLALTDICNKNKPNFMMIDEGFSCMDDANLLGVKSLLTKLKEKFDFTIVISHLDTMKDCCDKYIHIEKKNNSGDSFIC